MPVPQVILHKEAGPTSQSIAHDFTLRVKSALQ